MNCFKYRDFVEGICVYAHECVCVCKWGGEKDRERDREIEETETETGMSNLICGLRGNWWLSPIHQHCKQYKAKTFLSLKGTEDQYRKAVEPLSSDHNVECVRAWQHSNCVPSQTWGFWIEGERQERPPPEIHWFSANLMCYNFVVKTIIFTCSLIFEYKEQF